MFLYFRVGHWVPAIWRSRGGGQVETRLAYMAFPAQHSTRPHRTNPIERLSREIKRRADVVGIFPNDGSITRLIGAVPRGQNDEWQSQRRYMQLAAFPQTDRSSTDPLRSIQMNAA